MLALVSAYPIPHKELFDAHNLCYQISGGTCRYMTEEQEDILGKNYSNVMKGYYGMPKSKMQSKL